VKFVRAARTPRGDHNRIVPHNGLLLASDRNLGLYVLKLRAP